MIFKAIYRAITLMLVVPLIVWSAIASLIIWNAKYWHNAIYGISQVLDYEDRDDDIII